MNILIIGDVVGKTGREAVSKYLPNLRRALELDFVIINGENAANGFGITERICHAFYQAGADVITTGNHIWDQRDIINYIDDDPKLLRPVNFPEGTPGRGIGEFKCGAGRKILVINVMCRLFMDPLDDPFASIETALSNYFLGADAAAILIDIHGEASSEKQAMGHILDGRVSAVVGTHTHVPTADYNVLKGGTAYITDLGMTGDYDSVIGMKKEAAIGRFITKMPQGRLQPAEGEATFCAVHIKTDDVSGLARSIEPVRLGGQLAQRSSSLAFENPSS